MHRARIVAALVRVVHEQGAQSASVAAVIARAGVSRRTFYELFADRHECLAAAFEEGVERAAAAVIPAYEAERGWLAKVRSGLAALLGFLEREPAYARLCVVESLAAGPAVLARREQVLMELASVVDQGRRAARRRPPPLTAEAVVGGIFAVVHARLRQGDHGSLPGLSSELMAILTLPYLGVGAVRKELDRPPASAVSERTRRPTPPALPESVDGMRLTYRTLRVLEAIGEQPGASNREIAEAAGITDQGQMSKLLRRLAGLGLIENTGAGQLLGERNAWMLLRDGRAVLHAAVGSAMRVEPATARLRRSSV